VPYPAPLSAVRPIGAAFGAALVLSPSPSTAGFARLGLTLLPGSHAPSPAASPALEQLRRTTPAARCLPLLAALADDVAAAVALDYLEDMALMLNIAPRPAAGWQDPA
jgi:hypothetical protein